MYEISFPEECPYCLRGIKPIDHWTGHHLNLSNPIQWNNTHFYIKQCTYKDCNKCFIVEHRFNESHALVPILWKKRKVFSWDIKDISPNFEDIYNQAFAAEQDWLTEICWWWFRKALEFLIKDYLISVKPEKETDIKKVQLWPCINNYLDNQNIKNVAKRASWLWNDEIHYIRTWWTKDLEDIKALINMTVNWIELEIQTRQSLIDMPE